MEVHCSIDYPLQNSTNESFAIHWKKTESLRTEKQERRKGGIQLRGREEGSSDGGIMFRRGRLEMWIRRDELRRRKK